MASNCRQADKLNTERVLIHPPDLPEFDKKGLSGVRHEDAHLNVAAREHGPLAADQTPGEREVGDSTFAHEWGAPKNDGIGYRNSMVGTGVARVFCHLDASLGVECTVAVKNGTIPRRRGLL